MARFGAATHAGKRRTNNEDALAFDESLGVGVVADGLGGLESGEIASRVVVDHVMRAVRAGQSCVDGIQAAHRHLSRPVTGAASDDRASSRDQMASTVVAVRLAAGRAQIAWVGDSRCYLQRGGELRQLTRDHSFVAELLAAGAITDEEAAMHPLRNRLVRAVGVAEGSDTLKVDLVEIPLEPGDRLLVCTDGLHGFLPAAAVRDLLCSEVEDAQVIAGDLVEATLTQSSAEDNISAVCIVVSSR